MRGFLLHTGQSCVATFWSKQPDPKFWCVRTRSDALKNASTQNMLACGVSDLLWIYFPPNKIKAGRLRLNWKNTQASILRNHTCCLLEGRLRQKRQNVRTDTGGYSHATSMK